MFHSVTKTISTYMAPISAPSAIVMMHPTLFKVKTTKEEGIGVRSIVRNTSGVKGRAGTPRWGLKRMTSGLIIHMDLHKLNNKLVNA
jgi:hypothetical protein